MLTPYSPLDFVEALVRERHRPAGRNAARSRRSIGPKLAAIGRRLGGRRLGPAPLSA